MEQRLDGGQLESGTIALMLARVKRKACRRLNRVADIVGPLVLLERCTRVIDFRRKNRRAWSEARSCASGVMPWIASTTSRS